MKLQWFLSVSCHSFPFFIITSLTGFPTLQTFVSETSPWPWASSVSPCAARPEVTRWPENVDVDPQIEQE